MRGGPRGLQRSKPPRRYLRSWLAVWDCGPAGSGPPSPGGDPPPPPLPGLLPLHRACAPGVGGAGDQGRMQDRRSEDPATS